MVLTVSTDTSTGYPVEGTILNHRGRLRSPEAGPLLERTLSKVSRPHFSACGRRCRYFILRLSAMRLTRVALADKYGRPAASPVWFLRTSQPKVDRGSQFSPYGRRWSYFILPPPMPLTRVALADKSGAAVASSVVFSQTNQPKVDRGSSKFHGQMFGACVYDLPTV